MTPAISKQISLEEYLTSDDSTDTRYELMDGVLLEMPPESSLNALISLYLLVQFLRFVPLKQLRHKDTEIVVAGRVRFPDLLVLTEQLAQILHPAQRSTITPDMPAPALVVEVVSPGKTNEDRDYRYKRSEYAARGIPEYWIVNPDRGKVSLLVLVAGLYEEVVFVGGENITSPIFPELSLTAEQVLQAGQTE